MIRLILIATILILYLIIGIPVLLIEWVIGKFNPRARDISSLRMVQAAFKLMLWITGQSYNPRPILLSDNGGPSD